MSGGAGFAIALAGFGTGASLIVVIGAQNAFVLRQGLRREHVLPIVAVCVMSDWVLIATGALGMGALTRTAPVVLEVVRWAGAVFLLGYAAFAARRAFHPGAIGAEEGSGLSRSAAVLTCLALTWLNPHVYLDTMVVLGSIAAAHAGAGRWCFAVGAMAASLCWFSALGFGSRVLSGVLGRPAVWRAIDAGIAVLMVVLAIVLLIG